MICDAWLHGRDTCAAHKFIVNLVEKKADNNMK